MNFRAMGSLTVFAVLALAAPAGAAQRISIGSVQGDRGTLLANQLSAALCDTYQCVPRKRLVTDGKVDFAKMQAHHVSGFLLGSVIRREGKTKLWVALLRRSERPSHTWTLPVGAGSKLDPDALDGLKADLKEVLGAAAVAAPVAASAAPRGPAPETAGSPHIVLGAVSGEGAGALSRQLFRALCEEEFSCSPRSRAVTKGKVDYAKMTENGVAGFLFGSVSRSGKSSTAWLKFTTADARSRTWKLSLTQGGTLPASSLADVAEGMRDELGIHPTAPPPVAVPPPPPAAEAAPAAAAAAAAAVAAPAAVAPPAPEPPPPPAPAPMAKKEPPPPRAEERARQYFLSVEAGGFATSRGLSYTVPSGGSAPVGYNVTLAGGPWVGAEFFPLALATTGLASGLGVFANYATSIGLKSTDASGASLSTSLWWLRAGAEWRLRFIPGFDLAIVPAVAYLTQNFTVSPSYAGLPNSNLSGVEGSLLFDIPVLRSLSLVAGGGYVYWSGQGQLVGNAAYYTSGSAYALEAEAGFSARLFGPLGLRGLWIYSSTSYTLTTSSTYTATAAKDQYNGGRLTLFVTF